MSTFDSESDRYVRIPEAELTTIRLEHLTSAIDMSISLPEEISRVSTETVSGYTEWVAAWRGDQISVGWDWAFFREQLILIHPQEIRSNVRLISASGLAMSPAQTCVRLASWLETLPWGEGPIRELLQRNGRPTR